MIRVENLYYVIYVKEIVFSVDGFAECNDRIRKHKGHFEDTLQTIFLLKKEVVLAGSSLVIKVNTILLRENIDRFEEFCHVLADVGVRELTFNQLGGYDKPEFYQENRLKIDQVMEFKRKLPELKNKFMKLGLFIHGRDDYLNRIMSTTTDEKISIGNCNPVAWFWFINESGFISPCSYTSYEYMLPINSIKATDDVDLTETYFREFRKEKRFHWCDDCHCTQVYDKFE